MLHSRLWRKRQNMQTLLFFLVFSLERALIVSKVLFVCLFLLLFTTSSRKIAVHDLGNCPRWFYSMTLLQFVSKTKHELGWKDYLAFVGYNSSGTFGKKLVVMKIYLWKERKTAFASKPCSHEKVESLILHNNQYIVPIL